MRLSEIAFSDLMVAGAPEDCLTKASPDALALQPLDAQVHEELRRLRARLESLSPPPAHTGGEESDPDIRVDWEGMRLRVERMDTVSGCIYACRRLGANIQRLADLGFPPTLGKHLLSPAVRDGLIVFCGKTGSGKTTTAAAYISEWLRTHGGSCWTVENPVEMLLQGAHGPGFCYQTEVGDDADFGDGIHRILRAAPNLILIGEVRSREAAVEALNAANTGHLVVVTFHAGSVMQGISRLAQMGGDPAYLAEALRAVTFLRLVTQMSGIGRAAQSAPPGLRHTAPPRVLMVESLLFGANAEALRAHVRGGEFHMLASEIERQKRLSMLGTGGLP